MIYVYDEPRGFWFCDSSKAEKKWMFSWTGYFPWKTQVLWTFLCPVVRNVWWHLFLRNLDEITWSKFFEECGEIRIFLVKRGWMIRILIGMLLCIKRSLLCKTWFASGDLHFLHFSIENADELICILWFKYSDAIFYFAFWSTSTYLRSALFFSNTYLHRSSAFSTSIAPLFPLCWKS